MLDILIGSVNALLIIIIYKVIIRFWDYRIKQRLIQEGFIDEKSLEKIFEWNKKREMVSLLKLSIFSGVLSLSSFIISHLLPANNKEVIIISIVLFSVSLAAVLSYVFISNRIDP